MEKKYVCIIILIILLVYLLFIPRKSVQESFDNNNMIHGIPKCIYQTCEKIDTLPEKIKKNINYIKRMNKDWKHVLYDDNMIIDFITTYYGKNMLDIYNKINPKYGPARADLFRYLLMYKKGGVYLDIKSGTNKPLNEIITEETFYLAHWPGKEWSEKFPPNGEFQNWWIISPPGHPFIKNVIDKVSKNILNCNYNDKTGKNGVLHITGPLAYTEAILEVLNKYKHKIYNTGDELGFKYNNIEGHEWGDHIKLFKKHYTTLTEPIIQNCNNCNN